MKMKSNNWFILDDEAIIKIREAVGSALTQGEMMLRASCARKWYYRYALKLERRGFLDFNLVYGSLMHSLLQELYRTEAYQYLPHDFPVETTDDMMAQSTNGAVLTPKGLDEAELVRAKVQIAFNAYRMHYQRLDSHLMIKGVEKTLETEWNGLKLVGKPDLIARPNNRDGTFIWDFKTAGQLDAMSLDAWTFRFQFLFYCWLYWRTTEVKPIGMMINGLVKSALRPKIADRKTKELETQEAYLFRVKGDMMANREKYFYRQRIPLGTDALERFEKEILMPHLYAFKSLQLLGMEGEAMISALAMQMNTNQCHVYKTYCEYLSLCKDGRLALGEFDEREAKHPELDDEEIEAEA